jgi:hypothetical protein
MYQCWLEELQKLDPYITIKKTVHINVRLEKHVFLSLMERLHSTINTTKYFTYN